MNPRPSRRQTIGSRIFVGYGVIMALGMFFLLIVVSMLFDANTRQVTALEQRNRLELGRLRLRLALERELSGVRGYLLQGDENYLDPYREAIPLHQAALDDLGQLASTTEEIATLEEVRNQYGRFIFGAEQQITWYRRGLTEFSLALWQTEGRTRQDALEAAIDAFVTVHRRTIDEAVAASEQRRVLVYFMTLLMFIVAGISVLLSGRRLTRSITEPVGRLVEVAQAFSRSEFDRRATIQTGDELATLARVMNEMAANLAYSRAAIHLSLHSMEQRNRQLATLNSIAETLSQSLDLRLILGRTLDHVLSLTGMTKGWVWLLAGAGLEPAPLVIRDLTDAELEPLDQPEQRARLLTIARQGEVVMSSDQPRGDQPSGVTAKTTNSLLIPLATRDRTLGLIAVTGSTHQRVEPSEIELFQAIGRQIAVGIENARLFTAEQRLTKEALGLADTARLVSGSLQLEEILPTIVQSGVSLLNVDRCYIVLFADERRPQPSIYQHGLTADQIRLLQERASRVQAVVVRYVDEVACLAVSDVAAEPRPEIREVISGFEARSALFVSLQARGRPLGVLYFDTVTRKRDFSPQDQRVGVALGDQASVAIENALLYTSVEERAGQLAGMYEIGKVIAATLDRQELYTVLYRETRRLMDADVFFVSLLSADAAVQTRVFQIEGTRQFPPETVSYNNGLSGFVAATRRSLRASAEELERAEVTLERVGDSDVEVQSILCVPLVSEGRVLGVLSTQSYRPNAYTHQHLDLFEAIANQAAIAFENTNLQQQALDLAVIEERNRLARELHDSVTQMLFSITLTLQAGRLQLTRSPLQAEQHMDKAQQTAQEALAEMRSLIHQLRPASMNERGLVAALSGYIDGYRARTGLTVAFRHDGDAGEHQLTDAQEQALFRIAQEALNNINKHADAEHVEVGLVFEPSHVTIVVRDDGRGLPSERTVERPPTWGLTGMRERAEILGGTFVIESSPGEGTTIRARLPLTSGRLVAARGREEG